LLEVQIDIAEEISGGAGHDLRSPYLVGNIWSLSIFYSQSY